MGTPTFDEAVRALPGAVALRHHRVRPARKGPHAPNGYEADGPSRPSDPIGYLACLEPTRTVLLLGDPSRSFPGTLGAIERALWLSEAWDGSAWDVCVLHGPGGDVPARSRALAEAVRGAGGRAAAKDEPAALGLACPPELAGKWLETSLALSWRDASAFEPLQDRLLGAFVPEKGTARTGLVTGFLEVAEPGLGPAPDPRAALSAMAAAAPFLLPPEGAVPELGPQRAARAWASALAQAGDVGLPASDDPEGWASLRESLGVPAMVAALEAGVPPDEACPLP